MCVCGVQAVPAPLQALADEHERKVASGDARKRSSGFGGSGFKFNEDEEMENKKTKDMWRRDLETSAGITDFVEEEEAKREKDMEAAVLGDGDDDDEGAILSGSHAGKAGPSDAGGSGGGGASKPGDALEAARRAAMMIERKLDEAAGKAPTFQAEVHINDYPQQARFKVCHRDFMANIHEWFGCTLLVKGVHIEKGRRPNPGEVPLYLLVEGPSQIAVDKAARETLRFVEELALQFGFNERERGKYQVV